MPMLPFARFFQPKTSVLAQVPADPEEVSILALRLQEAKVAGTLTLEGMRLMSLEHQIRSAKKAKAQAASKKAVADDAKKAAAQAKARAKTHDRHATSAVAAAKTAISKSRAVDQQMTARDRLAAAKTDHRRATLQQQEAALAHSSARKAAALMQPRSCFGSRHGKAQ